MITPSSRERFRAELVGVVQGIGLRPEVFKLIAGSRVTGRISNGADGVVIELQGETGSVRGAIAGISELPIPALRIDRISVTPIPLVEDEVDFRILESAASGTGIELPPDRRPCSACLQDFNDPISRRHLYPLTACTSCGPRLTVSERLPYARSNTAMQPFGVCDRCAQEFVDPGDRRFNFETNSCWACGPGFVALDFANGRAVATSRRSDLLARWTEGIERTSYARPSGRSFAAILRALLAHLSEGRVVAIKSVGGYQLLADARNQHTIERLRDLKSRPYKPLAVMVQNISAARQLAVLSDLGARELESSRGPIVLAPARPGSVAPGVLMGRTRIGVALPASPLLHMLAASPLVVTSANISDSPIIIDDEFAMQMLPRLADVVLTHERRVTEGVDDSVVVDQGSCTGLIRRSRGYCPESIRIPDGSAVVLGVGADQKNVLALGRGGCATLSPHVGTMDGAASVRRWREALERLIQTQGATPDIVVCDSHPDFVTARLARETARRFGAELATVQHHHAHALAVGAEHLLTGPTVAVTLDGSGWGDDRELWGAEIFVIDGSHAERMHYGRQLPLLSGEASMREPWRQIAVIEDELDDEFMATMGHAFADSRIAGSNDAWRSYGDSRRALRSVLASSLRRVTSNSAGRLFDLAACLILGGFRSRYDGDLAQDMEDAATAELSRRGMAIEEVVNGDVDEAWTRAFSWGLAQSVAEVLPTPRAITLSVVEAEQRGPGSGALLFHLCLLGLLAGAAVGAARARQVSNFVLAGGSFQNEILLGGLRAALSARGLTVFTAECAPFGDGGIALGQVCFGRHLTEQR